MRTYSTHWATNHSKNFCGISTTILFLLENLWTSNLGSGWLGSSPLKSFMWSWSGIHWGCSWGKSCQAGQDESVMPGSSCWEFSSWSCELKCLCMHFQSSHLRIAELVHAISWLLQSKCIKKIDGSLVTFFDLAMEAKLCHFNCILLIY
jgi:hypothetical protein